MECVAGLHRPVEKSGWADAATAVDLLLDVLRDTPSPQEPGRVQYLFPRALETMSGIEIASAAISRAHCNAPRARSHRRWGWKQGQGGTMLGLEVYLGWYPRY
eukprot:1612332-Rhodomonas_salina.3